LKDGFSSDALATLRQTHQLSTEVLPPTYCLAGEADSQPYNNKRSNPFTSFGDPAGLEVRRKRTISFPQINDTTGPRIKVSSSEEGEE
jgi:hypothetical protein